MSSFDHTALIQNINEGIVLLKKSQPEAMQGFGQLACAAMAEGSISAKHKELMALAKRGITLELAEVKGPVVDRLQHTALGQALQGRVFQSVHAAFNLSSIDIS